MADQLTPAGHFSLLTGFVMQELGIHERKILAAMMRAKVEGRLEIPVVSEAAAHALRMRTYAILKKVRGKFSSHPEWAEQYRGLEEVMIQVEKGSKAKVIFLRKDQTAYMQALTEALGGEGAIPGDPTDAAADRAAEQLQERLRREGLIRPEERVEGVYPPAVQDETGMENFVRKPNPYYER